MLPLDTGEVAHTWKHPPPVCSLERASATKGSRVLWINCPHRHCLDQHCPPKPTPRPFPFDRPPGCSCPVHPSTDPLAFLFHCTSATPPPLSVLPLPLFLSLLSVLSLSCHPALSHCRLGLNTPISTIADPSRQFMRSHRPQDAASCPHPSPEHIPCTGYRPHPESNHSFHYE